MNNAGSSARDKIDDNDDDDDDDDNDDDKEISVKSSLPTPLLSPLFGSPPLIQQQQKNPVFEPFPKNSSTLLVAPSKTGKSWFLKVILENQELYFRNLISRVLVINCDPRIEFYELEETPEKSDGVAELPEVVQCTWDTYDPQDLSEGDLVIIDDLEEFNAQARDLVNKYAHHFNLAHVFVVTHAVLSQKNFGLLNFVHRVLLFLQSSAVSRLASYIEQTFFRDAELKEFIKKIIVVCERQKQPLLLEISSLPNHIAPLHVACSHLLSLTDKSCSFAVVYPHPSHFKMYHELSVSPKDNGGNPQLLQGILNPEKLPLPKNLIEGSFVLLNAEGISTLSKSAAAEDNSSEADATCLDMEQKWNDTVAEMEQKIENYIPTNRWLVAKNLLREILSNPEICVLSDRKQIMLKNNHKVRISILDFIQEATRREFPSEHFHQKTNSKEFQKYRIFVKLLLDSFAPKLLFKNKLLFPPAMLKEHLTQQLKSKQEAAAAAVTGGFGVVSRLKSKKRKKNKYAFDEVRRQQQQHQHHQHQTEDNFF